MFISVRTVESHVSALLRKLGLPGRPALVKLAQQLPGETARPGETRFADLSGATGAQRLGARLPP
jgi:hypothetical protein